MDACSAGDSCIRSLELKRNQEANLDLVVHQKLIREDQMMLEGPPPTITKGPILLNSTSTMDKGSEDVPPEPMNEPMDYQMPPEEVSKAR